MRNWNNCIGVKICQINIVSSVPMRNWNHQGWPRTGARQRFLAYLWGIETVIPLAGLAFAIEVSSVPMRNWNISIYEYVWWVQPVSSVPMRNWNRTLLHSRIQAENVSSVPMRNWNFTIKLYSGYFLRVSSVPMRNWNTTRWGWKHEAKTVSSVPMRNWNPGIIKFLTIIQTSF